MALQQAAASEAQQQHSMDAVQKEWTKLDAAHKAACRRHSQVHEYTLHRSDMHLITTSSNVVKGIRVSGLKRNCLLSRLSGAWRSWRWRARSVACVPGRLLQSMQWQHGGRSACRKPLPSSCSHWMLPGAIMPHVVLGRSAVVPRMMLCYHMDTMPDMHHVLHQKSSGC